MLAAARRLAEKLAELRAPDGAVRPDDYRHALREVASRCLYGVDINPMAVELCRVALWLETVDPGKPLGFLNHHIRPGNSLLGTTPDLIAAGLPDETFTAIEGDDKPACAELKKRNKAERTGFGPLFAKEEDSIREKLRQAATAIEAMDDSQPAALQQKEAAFLTNESAPEYHHAKLLADLWCAAFVIKKTYPSNPDDSQISNFKSQIAPPLEAGQLIHTDDDLFGQPVSAAKATAKPKSSSSFDIRHSAFGITTGTLRDYVQGKPLPADLESEVNQLASQYRFFHWHLAFPQVFYARQVSQLLDEHRRFKLSSDDIALLSPNTRTCSVFRTAFDAELCKAIYRNVPILIREGSASHNHWGVEFGRMFDVSGDSGDFLSRNQLEAEGWILSQSRFQKGDESCLPLYEAKMCDAFNHRSASVGVNTSVVLRQGQAERTSVDDLMSSSFVSLPRSWIHSSKIAAALPTGWKSSWLMGWRDITASTNERTLLAAVIPLAGVGDTFLLIFASQSPDTSAVLCGILNSYVVDYCARQKLGGLHLKYHVFKQLPVLPPATFAQPCPWANHPQSTIHNPQSTIHYPSATGSSPACWS